MGAKTYGSQDLPLSIPTKATIRFPDYSSPDPDGVTGFQSLLRLLSGFRRDAFSGYNFQFLSIPTKATIRFPGLYPIIQAEYSFQRWVARM